MNDLAMHLSQLRYFWEEKGDLERYCDWPVVSAALGPHHPIVKAWNDRQEVELRLTMLLKAVDGAL